MCVAHVTLVSSFGMKGDQETASNIKSRRQNAQILAKPQFKKRFEILAINLSTGMNDFLIPGLRLHVECNLNQPRLTPHEKVTIVSNAEK